ncbi:unnamed protein product [Adineta steineri]|uniref:Uncharacterized protein n=1 Tax=Adineta steineri TaxID=433720 RepID=A0A814ZTF7_9BILA|nr:unnamed protein product [Adineta steineri]CAF3576575.1 unnamed protein product [Adineta steineri]
MEGTQSTFKEEQLRLNVSSNPGKEILTERLSSWDQYQYEVPHHPIQDEKEENDMDEYESEDNDTDLEDDPENDDVNMYIKEIETNKHKSK